MSAIAPENGSNIDYLLTLAKDHTVESRSEIVAIIKDLFENKNAVLTDREKNFMFKIIEMLFREVEVSVRREIN